VDSRYFYVDENGNLQKYHYCCRCRKGPFKESGMHLNLCVILTFNHPPLTYCMPCYKILFPKKMEPNFDRPVNDIVPDEDAHVEEEL